MTNTNRKVHLDRNTKWVELLDREKEQSGPRAGSYLPTTDNIPKGAASAMDDAMIHNKKIDTHKYKYKYKYKYKEQSGPRAGSYLPTDNIFIFISFWFIFLHTN